MIIEKKKGIITKLVRYRQQQYEHFYMFLNLHPNQFTKYQSLLLFSILNRKMRGRKYDIVHLF